MASAFQPNAFQPNAFQTHEYPPVGGVGDVTPASYALTIGGLPQSIRAGTLRITETINGRNTMSFETVSWNASYRPSYGAEVIYVENTTRLFGGTIDRPVETGLFSTHGGRPLVNKISAVDFNSYAERRYVTESIPAGTLKAALQVLVTYLATYGVVLDPAQVSGPAVPQLIYTRMLLRECLDQLSVMTGYVWEIDYYKIMRMTVPGSVAAPYNVISASDSSIVSSVVVGDIEVETERPDPFNRVILSAGPRLPEDHVAGWNSDGVSATFTMYLTVLQHYGFVWVHYPLPDHPESLGAPGSGSQWIYEEAPQRITRVAGPLPVGTLVLMRYQANFPVTVTANHDVDQSVQGLWETVIEEPAVYVEAAAQALANAYRDKFATTFKYATYNTRKKGLKPGQTQTITVPSRNLSGTFLITEVETSDTVNRFTHRVKTVGGTTIPGSWRDLYRQWSGGGGTSSSGSVTLGLPAPGTTTIILGSPVFLGGSRNTSLAPNPVAWMPVVDYVPFTAPSSFSGRVRAQVFARNAGVSVACRLYNVTDAPDAVAVPSSSPVTSQTAVEVVFPVEITAGKKYRLEAISGTNGQGVFCIGVLESASS